MFWSAPAKQVNDIGSVPAPIGGLNAYDSLVAMPETDAIVLQNWWPQPYGVSVRKGYQEWTTGLPAEAASLATWSNVNGNLKLFAWAGTNAYDISSAGVVGAPLVTGLTNAVWESVNLVNAAGSHMIALNGFDDGIIYNAGGGNRIVAGDGIVANTWAGVDPKNCVGPIVHQHRLWVVEKNTANGWFLPPDAVQGTLKKYSFGPLFSRGGFLQFLATWTVDDGSGATDHLIAMSSRGEAAVYEGTDPEDDTKWALVGVYFIGAPVAGRRNYTKVGGDQFILTAQGIVSMGTVLGSTRVKDREKSFKSQKVQFLLSELTSTFGSLFGWDMKYFAKDNLLIINVPSVTAGGNIQLASNQITEAWTQFTGLDAAAWTSYGNQIMFSDYAGRVLLGWNGNQDDVKLDGTGGTGIIARAQQAYSYVKDGPTQKQIGMYRPVFITTSPVGFKSSIQYDFIRDDLTVPSVPTSEFGTVWGVGIWGTDLWGGGDAVVRQWVQAEGMGSAVSIRMVVHSDAEVLWVSTDYTVVGGRSVL